MELLKVTPEYNDEIGDFDQVGNMLLDGDDPTLDMVPADIPHVGVKINCLQCYQIFLETRKFKISDFDPGGEL